MPTELANVLTDLNWTDMNDLAERIADIATDDNGEPNSAQYIAQELIGAAYDSLG